MSTGSNVPWWNCYLLSETKIPREVQKLHRNVCRSVDSDPGWKLGWLLKDVFALDRLAAAWRNWACCNRWRRPDSYMT